MTNISLDNLDICNRDPSLCQLGVLKELLEVCVNQNEHGSGHYKHDKVFAGGGLVHVSSL